MVAFTLKIPRKVKKLLNVNDKEGLIPQVRKEFAKRGPIKTKQAISQDMIKGISPVKGKGKWKKYSKSYKETIRGKSTFRKFGSKTVKFKGKDKDFFARSKPHKNISPVNLRHSGELHNSLKVTTAGGFLRSFRLVVKFNHFLADVHNRLGAGKSKTIRRLLPTKKGEVFNRRITTVIINQLEKAANVIANQFSRQ